MGKYFGTDGIRGKYGDNLDAALAYKTGVALAEYFGAGEFYIARDTRVSGPKIEAALASGICDGGGTAVMCGIIPTPAIAYLASSHGGLCGIMVSASHNPPEYNGIKVFDGNGIKLNEEEEGSIEYYIDNPSIRMKEKGAQKSLPLAANEYIEFIVSSAKTDLTGLKLHLDCGYGAASTVAKEIFERLGAEAVAENFELNGEKINLGCGALYPDYILGRMAASGARIGFSFDGDADRLSVIYDGEVIDGDTVLYNISLERDLKDGIVVGTVLSNLALERQLEDEGRRLIRTPVGDKYICDLIKKKDYNLGGEQSGHYIIYPEATTGDGILSAIYFCKSVYKRGSLTKLKKLKLYPQKAIAEYADASILLRDDMRGLIERESEKLGKQGRLIVRMSGTEPKIRVMAESDDERAVDETLKVFKEFIAKVR